MKTAPTALVTGASSGIGLEMARVLADKAYSLILVARTEKALQELATELRQRGAPVVEVLAMDLAKVGAAKKISEQIQSRGLTVTHLINNAGFGDHGAFAESSWLKQADMLQVNIVALTELTHLFLPGMRQRKQGWILNVASTASFQPGPLMSVYYATKAFVLSFSEGLAEELRNDGVFVTALCPGPTHSKFMAVAGVGKMALLSVFSMPTSEKVARYGIQAMEAGQVVAVQGFFNWVSASTVGLLPRFLVRKMVRKLQESR